MIIKGITKIDEDDTLLKTLAEIYHLNFIKKVTGDNQLGFDYYAVDINVHNMLVPIKQQKLEEFIRNSKIKHGYDKETDSIYFKTGE